MAKIKIVGDKPLATNIEAGQLAKARQGGYFVMVTLLSDFKKGQLTAVHLGNGCVLSFKADELEYYNGTLELSNA